MSTSTGWSPFLSSSTHDIEENDRYLQREIEMLERAVADHGEMPRRERAAPWAASTGGPGASGAP